jgi:hypothetical protein
MKMSFFKTEDHSVYLLGLSLAALPFCAAGQSLQTAQTTNAWTAPDSTPYVATEIGANHCVWSKAVPVGTNEFALGKLGARGRGRFGDRDCRRNNSNAT